MSGENPWVVQPKKEYVELPCDFYNAVFVGVKDFVFKNESKWRFVWKVKTGAHEGKEASALVDRNISPSTLTGRLISGLLGREIKPGENVKEAIDACIGKVYIVSVQSGPKGGKACVRSAGTPPPM